MRDWEIVIALAKRRIALPPNAQAGARLPLLATSFISRYRAARFAGDESIGAAELEAVLHSLQTLLEESEQERHSPALSS